MTTRTTPQLSGVAADYVHAVNSHDSDAIVSLFAADAFVNDARREMNGPDAIRAWVAKEIVGDDVTMEVREVVERPGETILRSRYDGTFDKTNLPDEVILTDYLRIRDGQIDSLIVIFNQPSPY